MMAGDKQKLTTADKKVLEGIDIGYSYHHVNIKPISLEYHNWESGTTRKSGSAFKFDRGVSQEYVYFKNYFR